MKAPTTFSKTSRWPLIASSNIARACAIFNVIDLYVIGLYVNVHSKIKIFVLFLTACNFGTAQWKNFIPVLYSRATEELLNGA